MTDETLDHLRSLDPAFQPYAWHFVANWRRRGIPVLVISGRRSAAVNLDVGGATRSLHLQGLAFDVSIWIPRFGGHVPRDLIPFTWWQEFARPWEQLGGRWGGRFSTRDVNHFDAGPRSISV